MTPKPSTAIAYSYQRFSSPEQAKGDSLRRQTELRDAWLRRNGVTLDTTLTLRDQGVSGFKGAHRDDTKALGHFLALVQQGRIAKGSYLIVESLDRLSREHVQEALRLLLNLTASGIRVVQLLPVETIYDKRSDMVPLLMALMELSRGHSESQMKSERVGAAWSMKKRLAAERRVPLTRRLPAWLKMSGDRVVLDESKAASVRRIYDMAIAGHGITTITKRLNAERVPVVGSGPYWAKSTVAKLLSTRAVIGEYQPHTIRSGKRQPEGAPIPGYFPAAVTENKYHAARAAMASRRETGGRPSKRINLFQSLWRDARDGGKLGIVTKDSTLIVSYNARLGIDGAVYVGFPYTVFEESILSKLREIDPAEILPRDDNPADEALAIAGKLADYDARIAKLKAALIDSDEGLIDVLRALEAKRKELAEELAELKQQQATPLSAAWTEAATLLDALATAADEQEARTRIQSVLRRTVSEIWCLFLNRSSAGFDDKKGRVRIAAVQIHFQGGAHRDYLIIHQLAQKNAAARRDAITFTWSFADIAPGPLDLRKRNDAKKLLRELERMDLTPIFSRPRGNSRRAAKPK